MSCALYVQSTGQASHLLGCIRCVTWNCSCLESCHVQQIQLGGHPCTLQTNYAPDVNIAVIHQLFFLTYGKDNESSRNLWQIWIKMGKWHWIQLYLYLLWYDCQTIFCFQLLWYHHNASLWAHLCIMHRSPAAYVVKCSVDCCALIFMPACWSIAISTAEAWQWLIVLFTFLTHAYLWWWMSL